MKLLSTANPKIQKGTKLGYLSFILHLAPADLSGREVCPKRTAGCTSACLNTAGRGGMFRKSENTNMIQKALIAGMNVAVVYDKIPSGIYSADETDLRFLDPKVGIVGLKAKGRAKKDTTGFVRRVIPIAA